MRHCPLPVLAALGLIAASAWDAAAKVTLSTVLADDMVVQRDVPPVIWGMAEPGEKVRVVIGQATATAIHARCQEFAATHLALEFKPGEIRRTSGGVPFLGCRIFPTHVELNRRSKRRWRRRVRVLERAERLGLLSELNLQQWLTALTAFARAAGVKSWRFRRRVI